MKNSRRRTRKWPGSCAARAEDQLRYETLFAQLGPKNPAVVNARAVLAARNERMKKYADDLNDKFVIRRKADGVGVLISKDLSIQESSLRRLEELYNHQAAELDRLRKRRTEALNLVEQSQANRSARPAAGIEPTTRP